ncbi:MAG: ACT domain-containing protein [Methylococcales symbiont of Iophon sp. n. MRB-2018]|nr:MAG: ACT domain-containing protein [Methylococcales symbiont of Iophon sp. n. MRB-2018]KAF3979310.1 MAG: ACT domain-containing protein [Methylococcales symbiont of Iophon sp. n. MRB-2018]
MKQLKIITKNRLGIVTEISETLASENINIEYIDADIAAENVVVTLDVDQYDKALQLIHKMNNMKIVTEDAILIKLNNEPGALAKIARRFTDAGISLRGIHLINHDKEFALVAISTPRTKEAIQLVNDVIVT